MKVLISGATGFLGNNLVEYLSGKNYRLFAVVRDKTKVSPQLNNLLEKVFSYEELWNLQQCDFEVFINLAGKAHDLKKGALEQEYWQVNYDLALRFFNKYKEVITSRKFINISSIKAVVDQYNETIDETLPENPQSIYGKSKLAADKKMDSERLPTEKKLYILRPCMIHGPKNKGNLNLFYKVAQIGIPYPLAAFNNMRSFTSVENICFIIKNVIDADIPSDTFIVGDDEPLSTKELFQIISEEIGKRPRLLKIPKSVVRLVAKVGDYVGLPLNSERLQKMTEDYVVSNRKIKTALNISLPVKSREGIKKTIQSFQNNG